MDKVLKENEKIKKEILKKAKPRQLINYEEFLNLYKLYEEILSEVEFASILGVSYSNYMSMRNSGKRVRILKNEITSIKEEDKKKIKEEILKKAIPGQSIDYKEFLSLYKPYEDILSEIEFASILGVSYSNYMNIRNSGRRARILKKEKTSIKEEDKKKIKEEILKKVRPEQLINYEEFLNLYKPYEEILSEIEFASILDISYSNYKNIRNSGRRARILKKEKMGIKEEDKKKIKEEILKKARPGQSIDYKEFLILYKPYEEILSEIEFASILGISYPNYISMKNIGSRAIVKDYLVQRKINRVKHILNRSKYYSKAELEKLAKKYEIKLEVMLQYIFSFKDVKNVEPLLSSLEINGQLWIGHTKCSKPFLERYAQYMIEVTTKICSIFAYKCRANNIKDDIISNCIMYIIEKSGYIEKNCLTEEQIKIAMKAIISRYIVNSCKYRENLMFEKHFLKDESIFNRGIKDKTANTEGKIIEKILREDAFCSNEETIEESSLRLLTKYLEFGYSEEQAIIEVSKYVGIETKNLLKLLREYMISKRLVKEANDKTYILY